MQFTTTAFAFFLALSSSFAQENDKTILGTMAKEDDLTKIIDMVNQLNVADQITGVEKATVFAPTNEGLEDLDEKFLTPNWLPHALQIVFAHTILGKAMKSNDIKDGMEVGTQSGDFFNVTVSDDGVAFSGVGFTDAKVVKADLKGSNGIVHKVNKWFRPALLSTNLVSVMAGEKKLSTVVDLAGPAATSLSGDMTIFAPNNDAFDALPDGTLDSIKANPEEVAKLLKNHVVLQVLPYDMLEDGMELKTLGGSTLKVTVENPDNKVIKKVLVGGAAITAKDTLASNGIIHQMNGIMTTEEASAGGDKPKAPVAAPTAMETPTVSADDDSILGVISKESDMTQIVALANSLGVGSLISSASDVTVFAPTDEAVGKMDPKYLTDEWRPHAQAIVYLHAINGMVLKSADLKDGMTLSPIGGEELTVSVKDKDVMISGPGFNNSKVVKADLEGSNGVVHKVNPFFNPLALTKDLAQHIASMADYSAAMELVTAVNGEALLKTGDMTIFLPDNKAFQALPDGTVEGLKANPAEATKVLQYHVVPTSVIPLALMEDGTELTTASGQTVKISIKVAGEFKNYMVNGISIAKGDIIAKNGLVHGISGVLNSDDAPAQAPTEGGETPGNSLLETLSGDAELSGLVAAVKQAGLTDALKGADGLTVFAPSNEAFEKEVDKKYFEAEYDDHLKGILKNHVLKTVVQSKDVGALNGTNVTTLQGENITVLADVNGVSFFSSGFNKSTVTGADLTSSNGVVHKVDHVMKPYALLQDLVDLAQQSAEFSKVKKLLIQAEIEDEVRAPERTIFAPIDSAFSKLGKETLADFGNDIEVIRELLKYHICVGIHPTKSLSDGMELKTLDGDMLKIKQNETSKLFMVGRDNSNIVGVRLASNGLAHDIDTVLIKEGVSNGGGVPTAPMASPSAEAPSGSDKKPVGSSAVVPTMALTAVAAVVATLF